MKYPYETQKANSKKYSQHYLANLINVVSINNIFYGIHKSLCNVQIQLKLHTQQKKDLK